MNQTIHKFCKNTLESIHEEKFEIKFNSKVGKSSKLVRKLIQDLMIPKLN